MVHWVFQFGEDEIIFPIDICREQYNFLVKLSEGFYAFIYCFYF